VISYDQKRWEFSAASTEERDEWVSLIEEQIEKAVQAQTSQKQQQQRQGQARYNVDRKEVEAIKQMTGNDRCADCDAPNPDWASANLGILVCIECSGIHRNLGTHISKVRSLELDDWP
jgi:Arf-GAP/GTPase/ANK repeat/PH domain-containing protein 1/3